MVTTEQVADGVATFGRAFTIMSSIFFTFLSLVVLFIGIYILRIPEDQKDKPPKSLGWFFIFVAFFILVATWTWFYFVWTSKNVATVAGVLGATNVAGQAIDNVFE